MIDYHCHILPGVDDGVRKMEDTLQILDRYRELGIEEVWCTPHIMEDVPNTTESLKARFAELEAAYNGPIKLHLASEYMMDNLFDERLEARDLLRLGENQVLVETSYFNPPMDMMKTLERIKSMGLYPVLAHPERYMYMDHSFYRKLKEMDIRFQMNLGSLSGIYGRTVKRKCKWLRRHKFYDYTGTDLHSIKMLDMIDFD